MRVRLELPPRRTRPWVSQSGKSTAICDLAGPYLMNIIRKLQREANGDQDPAYADLVLEARERGLIP